MSSNRCVADKCNKRGQLAPKLTLRNIEGKPVGTAHLHELRYCTKCAAGFHISHSISDRLWFRIRRDVSTGQNQAMRGKTLVSWSPAKTTGQAKAAKRDALDQKWRGV